MSGPVDVRKDLNSIASLLEQLRQNNAAIMLDRVSAAVAELIEAAKQFRNLYGHLWDVTEPSGAGFLSPESVAKYDDAHERLQRALANVGGAK